MPIGQGWLNAWVKVNSKHVIFPSTSSASSHENQDDEAGGGGGAGDHQGDDHHAGRRRSGSGTQGNAATASPSSQTRNQIRKRMNSRKLKRGQQKRHGTSDYLSSSLKRKGKGGKDSVSSGSTRRPKSISIGSHDDLLNDESSRTAITAATATQHMGRRTQMQQQQHNDPNAANSIDGARGEMPAIAAGSAGVGRGVNNIGSGGGGGIAGIAPAAASLDARNRDDGASRSQNKGKDPSLNFVSGLFGGNLESRAQHFHQHQKQHEAMSVQHLQDRRMLETSSLASHGGHSAPVGGGSSRPATKKNDSLFSGGQGGLTLMFPFADGNGRCKSCKELEDDLTRCREDLETARNLALHYEMSLQHSNDTSSAANSMPTSDGVLEKNIDGVHATTPIMGSNSPLLASVVNQMNEMSIQHKKEMERLTKEKILWKQETHPKIQMFASLCKELDEEATLRNAEANSLHDELEKVVMERDTLATELAKLKVDAQQLEVHQMENRQLKTKLQLYEEHGINGADESIKARDHIIEQLMLRLKKATDTLDAEREQHLQRRKIIFPRPASSNVNGSSSTSGGGGSLNNSNSAAVESSERSELRATKTSLQEAEDAIEKLKLEHHRKELDWIRQMEQLKRKAEDAGGASQQNEQQQHHAVMDR